MTAFLFSSAIGPIPVTVVLSEDHTSEIEITANPIETGAEVNDHAYIKPKQIKMEIADANAAATYAALVRFQESRVPFTLITGLYIYEDQLIQSINATRDKETSRILKASVHCRQVIIVGTGTSQGDGQQQPGGSPGGDQSRSAAPPRSNDPVVSDRVAPTVQTGDNPTVSVAPEKAPSLLSRMFQ